jgi:hypothetical protein
LFLLKIFFARRREEVETGREEIDPFEVIDEPTPRDLSMREMK